MSRNEEQRELLVRFAQKKVFFPRDKPWVTDLVAELLRFSVGRYDDQVDVMSLFGLMLDKMWGRRARQKPERPYAGTGAELLDTLKAMGGQKGGVL